MNFKDLKQWEQLDKEIEFWENLVDNDGEDFGEAFPLCEIYNSDPVGTCCNGCPLREYVGSNCCEGTPFVKWELWNSKEHAQAMVDRLVEIRNKLFRLDR